MRYLIWLLLVLLVLFRQVNDRPVYQDGDRVRVTTKVTNEPAKFEYSQRLILSGLKVYLPRFPEISYGDKVVVEGTVLSNELKNPVLVFQDEGTGLIFKFRRKLIDFYQNSLPEPHASLVAGVTLGSKQSIPSDFWEALKTTGTAHVVVASGMNVTLVAGFLVNFLIIFMSRRKAVPLALVGIWVYALLSGFDAPIVRAAIMGSIGFSAQALGRLNDAWKGLFVSGLGMLIIRPDWMGDIGFILSFVATASLMLFQRRVYRKISFLPKIIREGFSTSLAAQIGVAPILWITFGQFNLLSPMINALVLWTIAPITMFGMISGFVGIFVPLIGRMILFIIFPLTSWFVGVVQFFG